MSLSVVTMEVKPFYEAEGWKPMTEEEIARALESLKDLPDAHLMYLPEVYCKRKGLDFEEANRTPSLKEHLQNQEAKRKPLTAKERLREKFEARKKAAAIEAGDGRDSGGDGSDDRGEASQGEEAAK